MSGAQAISAGVTVDGKAEQERARRAAVLRRRALGQKKLLIRTISLIVVISGWQILGMNIDPILFTTPIAVARAAVEMIISGELWHYLWPSLQVMFVGLAVAAIAGIVLGLLLARFWILEVALDMYVTFLYSTPTVALVPLIVLWAGFDNLAKIIILFLFAFFPMIINTYQGVKNVDSKLIEVGKSLKCNEWQMWVNIILPAALPFIVTGLRLAVGRGLIGMVLADLYTAISGIGYLIVRTASTYQIDRMFVPIVTLGILGIMFTGALRLVERWVAPWSAMRDRD